MSPKRAMNSISLTNRQSETGNTSCCATSTKALSKVTSKLSRSKQSTPSTPKISGIAVGSSSILEIPRLKDHVVKREEFQIMQCTNLVRLGNGQKELAWNKELCRVAAVWARDLCLKYSNPGAVSSRDDMTVARLKITDKSTICLAVNAFLSLKENDELEDGKTRMLHKEWRSCGAAIYGDAKQCYVVQIFSTGGGNGLIIDIMKAQKRT